MAADFQVAGLPAARFALDNRPYISSSAPWLFHPIHIYNILIFNEILSSNKPWVITPAPRATWAICPARGREQSLTPGLTSPAALSSQAAA